MTHLISTPFNPTLESTYLFNSQCPDYLGSIWKIRAKGSFSTDILSLANRVFTTLKNEFKKEFDLDSKCSNFLQLAYALSEKAFSKNGTDSEVFGMKYEATKAYEKAKHFETLIKQYNNSKTFEEVTTVIRQLNKSNFISTQVKDEMKKPNIIPMSLSEFRKILDDYKNQYARDVPSYLALKQYKYREELKDLEPRMAGLSEKSNDFYISPLYSLDIKTIIEREENEERRYNSILKLNFLNRSKCLNVDLSVLPLEANPNPSSGSYQYVRSCISLGESEFLNKTNEFLAFSKLKIIEEGISTSLIIYNHDGTPHAIFKPTSFAGGSPENPKGTQVSMGSDMIEQAALKEVAASKVMNSISGAPEAHLVEINLGGQILKGSLQAYVPHNRSVEELGFNLQYIIAEALGIDMPRGVLEKIAHGEAIAHQDQIQFFVAHQKYMQAISRSSYGMYVAQQSSKNYYEDIQRIPPEEVQQVGLHQLMTGNTDMNPANFLLTEKLDGGQQLIPVDFNLTFHKARALNMYFMNIAFWLNHPYASKSTAPDLISYFKEYNVKDMALQLQTLGLDEERVTNFELRATLIQKAVSEGLTLAETAYLFVPRVIESGTNLSNLSFEKTISEKLITSFYESYDIAPNQKAKEDIMEQYKKEVTQEIDALVQRLSDPKSFENQMRDLLKSINNPQSLRESEQNFLKFHEMMGFSNIMPDLELATDQQIEEDEQKICFADRLK